MDKKNILANGSCARKTEILSVRPNRSWKCSEKPFPLINVLIYNMVPYWWVDTKLVKSFFYSKVSTKEIAPKWNYWEMISTSTECALIEKCTIWVCIVSTECALIEKWTWKTNLMSHTVSNNVAVKLISTLTKDWTVIIRAFANIYSHLPIYGHHFSPQIAIALFRSGNRRHQWHFMAFFYLSFIWYLIKQKLNGRKQNTGKKDVESGLGHNQCS